jgi:mRNA-degrading endonuclease toxin of MazEF toxin-antitoxin module
MIRKSTLNKRAVIIVASSLAAISLTAVLIAAATQKGGRKPLQTRGLLDQTRSKKSVITTVVTHSQQQKEKQLLQPQSPWQGSETNKQTATATTTAAAIVSTTNASIDDKDITPPEVVLSSTVPSSTPGSTVIVSSSSSSTQTSREEEISVSDEAKKAGESLKELIVTAIKEAKDSATGTGKQLKEQTIDIAAKADSKDIHSLRDNVNVSVGLFEEMMIEIRKERYNEQIKLLDSYKDLLQTHIKVANARRKMASKLKPGS